MDNLKELRGKYKTVLGMNDTLILSIQLNDINFPFHTPSMSTTKANKIVHEVSFRQ